MKLYWNHLFRDVADAAGASDTSTDDLKDKADAADTGADGAGKDVNAGVGADKASSGADGADIGTDDGAKDKTGSLYDTMGVDEPGKNGSTSWPEDWRKQFAGEDEKAQKAMERFSSPEAFAKSYFAAQQRLRSGEYKRGLAPDATEEQVAEWRKEHGIPEAAKDYDVPIMLDGKYEDLDDFGKESVDTFRGAFHELNLPPEHASKIMTVANDVAVKQLERQAETDAHAQEEAEDALRTNWGPDYKKNIQLNAKFMQDKMGESWQSMIQARTPEGKRLADDPKFSKFINDMARSEGGTILETGEVVAGQNVQARIEEIRKIMSTDYSKYKREGLDVEYNKLLESQNR